MQNVIPRVAAIHDLSGFGRCSLSVIIPILSVMGVQVCPIPTAILSTHTGGFNNLHFTDFTENIMPYAKHWSTLGLSFDSIYTGFLGSSQQIEIVLELFSMFKNQHEKPLILVDPVMGDHGELYSTYTTEMQNKMLKLVEKADIITPNLTEAYFLLGRKYSDHKLDDLQMKDLLTNLSQHGPENVIITGVEARAGVEARDVVEASAGVEARDVVEPSEKIITKTDVENYVNLGYSKTSNTFWKVPYNYIPIQYPGTGDIFASVLLGAILSGHKLPQAMSKAAQFISLAVKTTYNLSTPEREGVLLEKVLYALNDINTTDVQNVNTPDIQNVNTRDVQGVNDGQNHVFEF